MKKTLLTIAVVGLTALSSFGQGSILFKNFGSGVNGSFVAGGVAVFDVDGTTKLPAGTGFDFQLWGGAQGTSQGSLTAVSTPINGVGSGLFGSPQYTVTGVAIGATGTFQVRVWNTAGGTLNTYAAALGAGAATGKSALIDVVLADPANLTAGSQPILLGLTSITLAVPEPSTFALLGLGAAGLLIRRRK